MRSVECHPMAPPLSRAGNLPKSLQNLSAVGLFRPATRRRDRSASMAIARLVSFCRARSTAAQRRTHGAGPGPKAMARCPSDAVGVGAGRRGGCIGVVDTDQEQSSVLETLRHDCNGVAPRFRSRDSLAGPARSPSLRPASTLQRSTSAPRRRVGGPICLHCKGKTANGLVALVSRRIVGTGARKSRGSPGPGRCRPFSCRSISGSILILTASGMRYAESKRIAVGNMRDNPSSAAK